MDEVDSRMIDILSQVGPGLQGITFLGFSLWFYDRYNMSPADQGELLRLIVSDLSICRSLIVPEYVDQAFSNCRYIILMTRPGNLPVAYSLFTVNGKDGFINLVCSQTIFPRLQTGLFVLCLTHIYLQNIGVNSVYLDAATEGLTEYYESLGYLFGKESCQSNDPDTENHLIYREGGQEMTSDGVIYPTGYIHFLPADYPTEYGYRMKLCNLSAQTICSKSYLSLKKSLQNVRLA